MIIAIFWLAHHRLFAHIVGVDQTIMWLNFGWFFAIAVLPLPTNLDIANPDATGNGFLRRLDAAHQSAADGHLLARAANSRTDGRGVQGPTKRGRRKFGVCWSPQSSP